MHSRIDTANVQACNYANYKRAKIEYGSEL